MDSIKSESGNYIYFIKETIIDTVESSGSSAKIDTAVTEFKIVESISNKVTIQLYPYYSIEFDRYLDSLSVGDSIVTIENNSFIPGTISISLKKNIGLYNLKNERKCSFSLRKL
ncbi:MAG: hypothetical protein H6613_03440 [Ignavibacteriales bacterium]|nr:hypothetical protein [Ignavibacteriales bacterium]